MKKEVDYEKLLADIEETHLKAADSLKDSFLGQCTAQVIEQHGEVSIALLRDTVEQAISRLSPIKGNKLMHKEYVTLNYLDYLLEKHLVNPPSRPTE